MVDVTIACSGSSPAKTVEAIESIARLVRECHVSAEFLIITATDGIEIPNEAGGFPVRRISLERDTAGDSLRAVVREAQGEWLITLHNPGPHDASLVYAFCHRRDREDLIIASRYVIGGSYTMPWLRSFVSRTLNWMYRTALSLPIRDLSSDRRMYRTSMLRRVPIESEDYDVFMEVLLRFMSKGGSVSEMPFHYESKRYRHEPGTMFRLFRSCLRTLKRMHALRNSIDFPDYDYRAYDSRIWLQRYWQRKRFQIIQRFTSEPGHILDIGCGSSRIITTRPEMFGLDINVNRLRFLRDKVPRRLQATAGALPFADEQFDIVLSSQVIEHTAELNCVQEAARVCKTGGTLVIGTPDYATFWWPITERLYGLARPTAYADEHIMHYTRQSLTREIERCGGEVEECRYVGGGELIVKAVKRRHLPDGDGPSELVLNQD
ncbi:MAG: methyltransferase domain-containing protein [Candidatus Hydrogenedentes bacterium]|nr:methyltransferase domain-containing protein [Candidatus Hydrogenedentota bacterium]